MSTAKEFAVTKKFKKRYYSGSDRKLWFRSKQNYDIKKIPKETFFILRKPTYTPPIFNSRGSPRALRLRRFWEGFFTAVSLIPE